MKLATEFVLLHEDSVLPDEESIFPSLWQEEDIKVEGDYYYDNIDNRWTNLTISYETIEKIHFLFNMRIYREHGRLYEPSISEHSDLKRYIKYRSDGRYKNDPLIHNIDNMCVTSMSLYTDTTELYQEFLKTIHNFLNHTKGWVVNYGFLGYLDATMFEQFFITDNPR